MHGCHRRHTSTVLPSCLSTISSRTESWHDFQCFTVTHKELWCNESLLLKVEIKKLGRQLLFLVVAVQFLSITSSVAWNGHILFWNSFSFWITLTWVTLTTNLPCCIHICKTTTTTKHEDLCMIQRSLDGIIFALIYLFHWSVFIQAIFVAFLAKCPCVFAAFHSGHIVSFLERSNFKALFQVVGGAQLTNPIEIWQLPGLSLRQSSAFGNIGRYCIFLDQEWRW